MSSASTCPWRNSRPPATNRRRRGVTGRSTTRPCTSSTSELEDPLDLDRDSERQRAHADRRASVLAALLAVELDEQVGRAVRDLRLVAELGHRVDEAEQLHDALDAVEAADGLADRRQHVQCHEPCRLLALLDPVLATELADELGLPVLEGPVPGDEENVPDGDGADVVADGRRHGGEPDPELLQTRLRAHEARLLAASCGVGRWPIAV